MFPVGEAIPGSPDEVWSPNLYPLATCDVPSVDLSAQHDYAGGLPVSSLG